MNGFTLFLRLFVPGVVLLIGSLAVLFLLRRHGAIPYALCGTLLIAGAAVIDRDYTLLAGQILSAWILCRMLRKTQKIPGENHMDGSESCKQKAPGDGGRNTMPDKRTTSQRL